MPAVSAKQQRLFGIALSIKRGKRAKPGSPAMKIAKTLSMPKIKDFANTKAI